MKRIIADLLVPFDAQEMIIWFAVVLAECFKGLNFVTSSISNAR